MPRVGSYTTLLCALMLMLLCAGLAVLTYPLGFYFGGGIVSLLLCVFLSILAVWLVVSLFRPR